MDERTHRYIILIDERVKSFSAGYLRNSREMNIPNSWIFLALNIVSNLFSIDILDKRRIDINFIQDFVIAMYQAS